MDISLEYHFLAASKFTRSKLSTCPNFTVLFSLSVVACDLSVRDTRCKYRAAACDTRPKNHTNGPYG